MDKDKRRVRRNLVAKHARKYNRSEYHEPSVVYKRKNKHPVRDFDPYGGGSTGRYWKLLRGAVWPSRGRYRVTLDVKKNRPWGRLSVNKAIII